MVSSSGLIVTAVVAGRVATVPAGQNAGRTAARAAGRLFGVPLPGLDEGRYDIADECALVFAGTFFALFLELWRAAPFAVPAPEQIDPGLRDQLSRYRDALGTDIPVGAVLTFLRCWTVLYGAVAMEVFGHIRFALEDAAPMFEMTLGDLAALVGLSYPLPSD